jgi:protocatechuate 3,4-dioxygenase beta subunit
MSRIPPPTQTPHGPAYEGRLLPHAEEPVVDQGATFDIGTILTRRRMLGFLGLGAGAAVLAACAPIASGSTATSTPTASTTPSASASTGTTSGTLPAGEIPDETAGPYPGDGSNGPDVLEMTGIVRSDIRSSLGGGTTADGIPLTFTLALTDMANGDAPFEGVAVYAWHCDAAGRYSMYSDGVADETFLRGVQVADADGTVTFTSILPGCYSGRWPHIHFEVYPDAASITDSGNAIATSQLAFPENMLTTAYADSRYPNSAQNLSQVSLATDNVFGEDGAALQLATITGDASSGYTATLALRVDTTTEPTGGGIGGGPGSR